MNIPHTTGWHVPADALVAYRQGQVHGASADSVEAHLLRCAGCRAALAEATPRSPGSSSNPSPARSSDVETDTVWERIADVVDRPSSWSRRSTWMRLAVGTPQLALTAACLALAFLVVPVVAAAVDERAAVTWFLALAPAVPIAGTLLAYRAAADPVGELAEATPLHSFRIVLMRVAVLLLALLPAGLVGSVLLPGDVTLFLCWVLPSLACSAVVLAVGTRFDPVWAAGTLAAAWAATVFVGLGRQRLVPLRDAIEALAISRPGAQLAAVAVGAAALVHLGWHRDQLATRSAS